MVKVTWSREFERVFKKIRDSSLKSKTIKHIERIVKDPQTGKPLRYTLKGERTVRVGPYRLIYALDGDALVLLRLLHRKKVYR